MAIALNPRLSRSDRGLAWINQFSAEDRFDATRLLDSIALVSATDFAERLEALAESRLTAGLNGPIALYAEREIGGADAAALFREEDVGGHRRAIGEGPHPVAALSPTSPEVGSEGLIAGLITSLCRRRPLDFLNHPGPDMIRARKARTFLLLTDFVGSGNRATSYLESAWRVASVRSWWSYGLMRFEVLAYSATEEGRRVVQAHPTRPTLDVVAPCPTIQTQFSREIDRNRIVSLCVRNDPVRSDPVRSLGYRGGGALIVFAHGCPNNAPRVLHRDGKNWAALFPGRSSAGLRNLFGDFRDQDDIQLRLAALGEKRLAKGGWIKRTTKEGRMLVLILALLRSRRRSTDILALHTGLTKREVRSFTGTLRLLRFIDDRYRVTDEGIRQLEHARKTAKRSKDLVSVAQESFYYPQSLRAPK